MELTVIILSWLFMAYMATIIKSLRKELKHQKQLAFVLRHRLGDKQDLITDFGHDVEPPEPTNKIYYDTELKTVVYEQNEKTHVEVKDCGTYEDYIKNEIDKRQKAVYSSGFDLTVSTYKNKIKLVIDNGRYYIFHKNSSLKHELIAKIKEQNVKYSINIFAFDGKVFQTFEEMPNDNAILNLYTINCLLKSDGEIEITEQIDHRFKYHDIKGKVKNVDTKAFKDGEAIFLDPEKGGALKVATNNEYIPYWWEGFTIDMFNESYNISPGSYKYLNNNIKQYPYTTFGELTKGTIYVYIDKEVKSSTTPPEPHHVMLYTIIYVESAKQYKVIDQRGKARV